MSTTVILTIFFILSLFAAFVLFKFLKSSAIIKKKTYQAGGALAGFIIIYGTLFSSYSYIEKGECKRKMKELEELREKFEEKSIRGRIVPPKKNTMVVLAVREKTPDKKGEFQLTAPFMDFTKGEYRIYVLTEDDYFPWNIYSEEDTKDIEIPIE